MIRLQVIKDCLQKRSFLFFGLVLLHLSCNKGISKEVSGYIQSITNAKSIQISSRENITTITARYELPISMQRDYLASIMAMSLSDTIADFLTEKRIEEIQVILNVAGYPKPDTFLYPVGLLEEYKKGIKASSHFISNLLNENSENSIDLVDTTQIPRSKLMDLNTIGSQIKSQMNIEQISYDGFGINPTDPRIIQSTVQLTNKEQQMLLTFQYNILTHKIFYFGLNDEN